MRGKKRPRRLGLSPSYRLRASLPISFQQSRNPSSRRTGSTISLFFKAPPSFLYLRLLLFPRRRCRRAPDARARSLRQGHQIAAEASPLPRPPPQRRHQQEGVRRAGAAEGDRRDDDRHRAAGELEVQFFLFSTSNEKKKTRQDPLSLSFSYPFLISLSSEFSSSHLLLYR